MKSPIPNDKININISTSNSDIKLKKKDDASFKFATSSWAEAKILIHISTTVGLALLCEVLPIFLIPTVFIGNLTDEYNTTNASTSILLAASGLARTFSNVTSTSIGWGLTSALYTLIPECVGANKKYLLQIYVQRAAFIIFVSLIPLTLIQWFGADILCYLLKQPMNLYPYINKYCHALIPNAWCVSSISILQRCGQSLNLNTEFFWVVFIPFLLNIPLNIFCIYYLKWGYIGTAIVYDVTTFLSVILSVSVMFYRGYGFIFKPIHPFFNVVCSKQGLYDYLSLTLPGCVQMSLMWWISESIIILSGYVKNPSVAVSVTLIISSVHIIFGLISEALGCALTIRVGKYIGAASIEFAKRSIKIACYIDLFILIFMTLIILLFRHSIPKLFINNEDIVILSSYMFYILLAREYAFNWYTMLASIYRALGYQKIMAIVSIISQYVISLPIIVFILFYHKLDLIGNTLKGLNVIWSGTTFGYLLSAAAFGFMMYANCYFSWKYALNKSTTRIKTTVKDYGSININTKNNKNIS